MVFTTVWIYIWSYDSYLLISREGEFSSRKRPYQMQQVLHNNFQMIGYTDLI